MLPQKIFENLRTVVTILLPFEQILGKFFAPKSECFTKYEAFCSHTFDYACLGRKAYCYRKGLKLWKKLHSLNTCFKMAGGGMHPTLDPPPPALITMSLTTTPTSRFGFSKMGGKVCQSCLEIRGRTALAQLGHFTLKTSVPCWYHQIIHFHK